MGTNYYRKRILTEDEINKLTSDFRHCISSNTDIDEFKSELDEVTKHVHICKISYGWKVNFDHNWGEYYELNRNSITKFLSEENSYICDEYGDRYTVDEFWAVVDSHNANPKNIYTSELYDEEQRKQGKYVYDYCSEYRSKVKEIFDIDTVNSDFESDGLRFAVFDNFS